MYHQIFGSFYLFPSPKPPKSFPTKGRLKKIPSNLVILSKTVGGGQNEITILGASEIMTSLEDAGGLKNQ